ncbi:MAG: TetR/AcrR family transcriptional regulator [Myxococcales bacterium]|nr:TetR/AcrR family transcriptional regulator [Myxococcales bacterium]
MSAVINWRQAMTKPSGRQPARTRKTSGPRTGPKTSRAAQRAGTREQIRIAAFEHFSTIGFDETTTQAIAQRAGVAAGTVFLHASDKADLLFLVMHDRLEAMMARVFETLPDAPLLERLLHVFRGVFAMYAEHPKMGAAFVRVLPGASGPNAQRTNTLTFGFLHRLGLLVSDAQARGEVASDLNPTACAQNIFGLYFMTLLGWLSGHYTLETALDPMLRSSLELQIRGFRPSQ